MILRALYKYLNNNIILKLLTSATVVQPPDKCKIHVHRA